MSTLARVELFPQGAHDHAGIPLSYARFGYLSGGGGNILYGILVVYALLAALAVWLVDATVRRVRRP